MEITSVTKKPKKINLFDLPSNILEIIYEYDDTYREKFNTVLYEIRGSLWKRYLKNLQVGRLQKIAITHILNKYGFIKGENPDIYPEKIHFNFNSGKTISLGKSKKLPFYNCTMIYRSDYYAIVYLCKCGKIYESTDPSKECWESCAEQMSRNDMRNTLGEMCRDSWR